MVPVILSLATAAMTAYSIATGLDRKVRTMAKLSASWREIASAYDRLWNHTGDADAEQQLNEIVKLEKEPSDLATTEAPHHERRLDRWQKQVWYLHGVKAQD